MPEKRAESYRWLEDANVTTFSGGACVTATTGTSFESALATFGADVNRPSHTDEASRTPGIAWVSIVHATPELPPGAVVLIENGGWEGSQPEVLSRLSRGGAAASVYWDVNDLVIFGCARKGKIQSSVEVPEEENDLNELPATLRRVWRREAGKAGPVAISMAMLETFTGVAVPPIRGITHPQLAYPVTKPVLTFRLSGRELHDLQRPSPAVVAAAATASSSRRRFVAEWAAREALREAGISDLPQLRATVQQFGMGSPVRLTPRAIRYRREAEMAANAVSYASTADGDTSRWQELRLWTSRHWAMEALAYTTAEDDLMAVLGATYCAGMQQGLGSAKHQQFLNNVLEQIGR